LDRRGLRIQSFQWRPSSRRIEHHRIERTKASGQTLKWRVEQQAGWKEKAHRTKRQSPQEGVSLRRREAMSLNEEAPRIYCSM
jgi:hypothetical protein